EWSQLGVLRGDVQQVAALEAETPVLHVREGAHAVPLDLVRVVVVGRRQRAEARLHRFDVTWERHTSQFSVGPPRVLHTACTLSNVRPAGSRRRAATMSSGAFSSRAAATSSSRPAGNAA